MSNKHICIDLETFGVGRDAVITEIGYCVFTAEKPVAAAGVVVNLKSCTDLGFRIDPDTLKYRLRETPKAFNDEMFDGGQPIRKALETLSAAFLKHQPFTVFANSPSFDCAILTEYYNTLGMTVPWRFWQERDVRTLIKMTGHKHEKPITHVGKEDAIAEAKAVIAIAKKLKLEII